MALKQTQTIMDELSTYPYLFDRRRSSHDWLESLGELGRDNEPENKALAQNWRMDHRVCADYEKGMMQSGFFPQLDSPQDFMQSIRGYFREYLCTSGTSRATMPAYLMAANERNRIPNDTLSPNQTLLHIASLSTLLRRTVGEYDVQEAVYQLIGVYPSGQQNLSQDEVNQIALALMESGSDRVQEFAGVISDQMGPTEPHWWAAFSFEVDHYLEDEDWTDAVRVLGLGQYDEGEWLMAWRYSPVVAGPLYRPTVVEANSSGYHFPSPPREPLGVAMPLEAGLAAVKEVIHSPLKGDANVAACIGRLGRVGKPVVEDQHLPDPNWLAKRREDHARKLGDYYAEQPIGHPVNNWFRRHGLGRDKLAQ